MKSEKANEEITTLWVRAEPGMVYELRCEFKLFLRTPEIREQSTVYRKRILRICLNLYAQMKIRALADVLNAPRPVALSYKKGIIFITGTFWLL